MTIFIVVLIACSYVCTALLRQYALAENIMDIPNERSSHQIPTPRGGGIGFVATFLLALFGLGFLKILPWNIVFGFGLSGFLIALIGFIDDRHSLSPIVRLCGQFVASIFTLHCLGLLTMGFSGEWSFLGNFVLNAVAVVFLVWMINLYNFMDGIDGLASVEAITVAASFIGIASAIGYAGILWIPEILAASVLGFLLWNFPPAKIFMGDAGSGFLGLILGSLLIQSAKSDFHLAVSLFILLGCFITDATYTLVKRLIQGDKVYQAHCSHAYQHAAGRCNGHLMVTFVVFLLNLFWLSPMAYLVAKHTLSIPWGLFLAYLPLLVLATYFEAGKSRVLS